MALNRPLPGSRGGIMRDLWPWRLPLAAATVLGLCVLAGYCVHDYRSSVRQTLDATIVGGNFYPGHYDTSCSSNSEGHTTCDTDWVPPRWTVDYIDEKDSSHTETVDEKTYTALTIGRKVYVTFWEGPVFGIRYQVVFRTERPPAVER